MTRLSKPRTQHFEIPTDLTRGEMLERIYTQHTGPEPLPSIERVQSPIPRLGREAEAVSSVPQTGESLAGVAPPRIAGVSQTQDPPKALPDVDYVVRFPTPSDTYTPEPSPPRSPGGGYISTASSPAPVRKPRMQFVYPPIPRAPKRPDDEVKEAPRAFSPGASWLEKMYVDLKRGRTEVRNDLEEAKREVQQAIEEIARADVALKREAKETKQFLDELRKVAGEEVVAEIIAEANRRAEGGATDEEDVDDGDNDSDGGGDDGNEQGSSSQNRPKPSRLASSGSSSTERRGSAPGSGDAGSDIAPSDHDSHEMRGEVNDKDEDSRKEKAPSHAPSTHLDLPPLEQTDEEDPPQTFGLTFSMVFGNNALSTEEIHRRIEEHIKIQPSPTETNPTPHPTGPSQPTASSSRKRSREEREDLEDSGGAESELEVERSIRLSAGEEENDGSHRDAKRRRFTGGCNDSSLDGDSTDASLNESPSGRDPHREFFASDAEDSSSDGTSSNGNDDGLVGVTILEYRGNNEEEDDDDDFEEQDVEDEEPDAHEFDVDDDRLDYEEDHDVQVILYFTREGSHGGTWTSERREPLPPWASKSPKFYSSSPLPSSPGLPFPQSRFETPAESSTGLSSSQPIAGPSHQPIAGPSSTQPMAGPSATIRHPRPLTRARERIRETASGGVEAYNYEEESEYEEREERMQQLTAEWRHLSALRTLRSGNVFNAEFNTMRAPPEAAISFAGSAEEFEGDEDEDDEVEEEDAACNTGNLLFIPKHYPIPSCTNCGNNRRRSSQFSERFSSPHSVYRAITGTLSG